MMVMQEEHWAICTPLHWGSCIRFTKRSVGIFVGRPCLAGCAVQQCGRTCSTDLQTLQTLQRPTPYRDIHLTETYTLQRPTPCRDLQRPLQTYKPPEKGHHINPLRAAVSLTTPPPPAEDPQLFPVSVSRRLERRDGTVPCAVLARNSTPANRGGSECRRGGSVWHYWAECCGVRP